MDRQGGKKVVARLEVYRNGQLLSTIEDEVLFPDEKTMLNMKAAGCRAFWTARSGRGAKQEKRRRNDAEKVGKRTLSGAGFKKLYA